MARKKKKNRPPKLAISDLDPIRFELEDNAEQMMEEFLKQETSIPDYDREDDIDVKAARRRRSPYELDLHRMTLSEAEEYCLREITKMLATERSRFTVRIITGKGRHSGAEGAVLPKSIHVFVRREFADVIESMQDSPEAVRIEGLPWRGHFDVVFKPKP